MPYLPVDLDAKRKAEGIERALGLPRLSVVGGLVDLWETVWREKSDVVDELALGASFGSDERIRGALVAREFLEPIDGRWRVRGAAKWLFGMEGRKRGGQAAKTNLIPGARQKKSAERSPETPRPEAETFSAPAQSQPRPPLGSTLGSYTQHPAPSTQIEKKEAPPPNPIAAVGGLRVESVAAGALPGRRAGDRPAAPRVPVTVVAPTKDPELWDGEDFWAWAESVRQEGGLVAGPRPRALGSWFNTCLMTEGVTVHALKEAFYAFGQDKHWEEQRFPFQAFMSQWTSFARKDPTYASAS